MSALLVICVIFGVVLEESEGSTLVASTRLTDYSNLTCPINCTCSTHEPNRAAVTEQYALPFDTLAPKQTVECENIAEGNVRDVFSSIPDGVTSFTLRHAGLTSLTDICCMEDLESLDLAYNDISDLIVYVEFEKLTFLNLQNNALRILRKDEFISFPNLETLNIDSNEIQVIDHESFRLMRLQQLHLSQNKITYVNERAFRYAANLETLNLAGNFLTAIHARNFYFSRKLRSLDLSLNQLTHVDEYGFDPLYRLEELNLSFNNMTAVPSLALKKLTSLKWLVLDGNPVSILDNGSLSDLPSLEILRMDQMAELTLILAGAFGDLPRLRRLSICGCKRLQFLSPNAFSKDIPSLKELYLTNNGLTFLPASIARFVSLHRIDISGNPLDCRCLRRVLSQLTERNATRSIGPAQALCSNRDSNRPSAVFGTVHQCTPNVVPAWNTSLNRSIGVPISLYCAVIAEEIETNEDRYTPVWTLPNGNQLTAGQRSQRFYVDQERLKIEFLLQDDSGRYRCSVGIMRNGTSPVDVPNNVNFRYVDLHVDSMGSVITPADVSAYHVTWTWSQRSIGLDFFSTPHSHHRHRQSLNLPPGEYRLVFKGELEREYVSVDLPESWERYTVNRLRPETNYSFCLIYLRDHVALYKYCTSVRTEKAYVHFGVSLNYSLIGLLAVSITLICALCVARCVHKRLHIWQEEKYRGRMQESMSAQGFLTGFDSISTGSLANANHSVTFENTVALDTGGQQEEAETALDEASTSMGHNRRTGKVATRGIRRKGASTSKYMSSLVVDTHHAA